MIDRLLNGNLINAYFICKRKVWLFAHEINPAKDHPYLELGRFIGETTYKREKKEILIENIKIDLIRKGRENLLVAEIKKSSKGAEAAEMQLLFYLYELKQKGIIAKGELLFPKERKRKEVALTPDKEAEIERITKDIFRIIYQETPPPVERKSICKKCAFYEFCFGEEE